MDISRLADRYLELEKQRTELVVDIHTICKLVDGVQYTEDQHTALYNVATRHMKLLKTVEEELFATSQLLEVYRANDTMGSGSALH